MKRTVFCSVGALLLSVTPVVADDYVEFTFGKASEGIDVLRIAWRSPWSARWFATSTGELSGFHAVSFNHWQGEDDSLNAVAWSPVFVYRFHNAPISYVKLGVGAAYLSDTKIKSRNLGSYFQFEDQIGVGWDWHWHDLSLVYMHYSNAGSEDPNHGIDMVLLAYAWRF